MRSFLALSLACALTAGACHLACASAAARSSSPSAANDNAELKQLHDEDQADREPENIDWSVVGPRDQARLKRVKELFAANALRTANDYYRAAMVLQHGSVPEDFLLGHELCVAAMMKGRTDKETAWLAASAEDRYLMNLGRPQRFGTQFHSEGSGPVKLYTVDESPGVTDELRRLMSVHSLAEAKAHEAELNQ